jgi:hypothetical protein
MNDHQVGDRPEDSPDEARRTTWHRPELLTYGRVQADTTANTYNMGDALSSLDS